MAEIVYLTPGEDAPNHGDDQPWLRIEATSDGLFYGTGCSWKPNGEFVGYCSLPEDDVSLETAMTAAQEWAAKYGVPIIWVQLTP
ncbi:hypothetical protein [Brevundimonas sp. Root1279]|uniref:hypothetical protein n=1 Tax=Brevundimonas sp. Root1279 TaxID=1736443 RepID=UPI0006F6CE5A|nr:hypothetical protein [Brevundimonas sp. Root1279]KQW86339.1 hypothetical protein ASC65_00030 [Brevundimonas sp. Root1279]